MEDGAGICNMMLVSNDCVAPALEGGGQCSATDPCLANDEASCPSGCWWETVTYMEEWCSSKIDKCADEA